MYLEYFGLREAPFSIAPSPRYLYMSRRHQEALAHLLFGIQGEGGFVLLTGEVGTGKTTICRCLLGQMPASCDVAYIFNPRLSVEELLATLCVEFGIQGAPASASVKVFVDCINAHLLDAHAGGRQAVLIIDEAQNLSVDVLEQIRLLTNLETDACKLLRVILLGQPELREMLARPQLRQLAQRILARYHLDALDKTEVAEYVQHRLAVAGCRRPLFTHSALTRLYRLSGGVPRVINVLCDRALLGAYAQGRERVDRAILQHEAAEVRPRTSFWSRRPRLAPFTVLVLALALAGGWTWFAPRRQAMPEQVQGSPQGPPVPATRLGGAAGERAVESDPAWLDDALAASTVESAHQALLQAWGVGYRADDLCHQAEAVGLRCRGGRAGLDELRRLNLPAILYLRTARGRPTQVALTGLSAQAASLVLQGQTRTVPLSALATHWLGEYLLLWRPVAGVEGPIRPGTRGVGVDWLRACMATLRGSRDGARAGDVFDSALLDEVKRFQLRHGLVPDGSVGPETMIRLIGALDSGVPRLYAREGGP